jgi:hypothetical protein
MVVSEGSVNSTSSLSFLVSTIAQLSLLDGYRFYGEKAGA